MPLPDYVCRRRCENITISSASKNDVARCLQSCSSLHRTNTHSLNPDGNCLEPAILNYNNGATSKMALHAWVLNCSDSRYRIEDGYEPLKRNAMKTSWMEYHAKYSKPHENTESHLTRCYISTQHSRLLADPLKIGNDLRNKRIVLACLCGQQCVMPLPYDL